MNNKPEIKHGMPVQRKMTTGDFQKAAGGGVSFGANNEHLSEIFVAAFIEWGGEGYYLKNEEIERLYIEIFKPLMLSPTNIDPKKKIIKKIFEKWPESRKITMRESGKVLRMIEGVKTNEVLLSPVELMERKIEELKKEKNEKEKLRKEKRRLKRRIKKQVRLTPYDIIGPCPGEDSSFSAFDYLRKQPLPGWDSLAKREWYQKIMREVMKK